jgi:hypothetical protein
METNVTISNEAGTAVIATGIAVGGFMLANGGNVNIVTGLANLAVHGEYQVSYLGATRGMMCTALAGVVATFN